MRTRHPIVRKTRVPLYDSLELALVVADDLMVGAREVASWINPEDHGIEESDVCLANTDDHGKFVIIFKRGELTHDAIGHEIAHCAGYMMKFLGIKYDPDNDEPFAYLIGWLSDFVYRNIPKTL